MFLGKGGLSTLQRWSRAIIEGVAKEVIEEVNIDRVRKKRNKIQLNLDHIAIGFRRWAVDWYTARYDG